MMRFSKLKILNTKKIDKNLDNMYFVYEKDIAQFLANSICYVEILTSQFVEKMFFLACLDFPYVVKLVANVQEINF